MGKDFKHISEMEEIFDKVLQTPLRRISTIQKRNTENRKLLRLQIIRTLPVHRIFDFRIKVRVCGTGLSQEEVTLAGYNAHVGTYDDHEHWDFITFGDERPQIVAQSIDCDSWISHMWDEADTWKNHK